MPRRYGFLARYQREPAEAGAFRAIAFGKDPSYRKRRIDGTKTSREGAGLTNAMGQRVQKDRRRERRLPPEHDFSVTALGTSVILAVIAVMLAV